MMQKIDFSPKIVFTHYLWAGVSLRGLARQLTWVFQEASNFLEEIGLRL